MVGAGDGHPSEGHMKRSSCSVPDWVGADMKKRLPFATLTAQVM